MISLRYYRIYDIGKEIDLDLLEKNLALTFCTTRTNFLRIKPKSIILENKPLIIKTDCIEVEKDGKKFEFSVLSRIYDIGALSLCFIYESPDGNYDELEELAFYFSENNILSDDLFNRTLDILAGKLRPILKDLNYDPDFYEDYTIYVNDTVEIKGDPVKLLMCEDADFSSHIRNEFEKNTLSYTKNDLSIISWDSTLLCSSDTPGPMDIIDLIEYANVQVLELRYYDRELNRQMEKMYDDIEHADRSPPFLKLRQYHLIMNTLMERSAEISEVIEKVHNLIKITEDVYYARVYETTLKVIRSGQWTESVSRKIETIQNNYSMLSDEVRIQHSNFLEWIVIILIAMELVLLL
ncbi:hypothetical protein L1994_08850 [Methanomicrobium antiquum]|uniref:DUF155 domain-containing protein n=1 Tax=Methanomicrobium antiquum TaxID=487686 RepID=A0AAF0JL46_9EURY|nr:hypothetical protein [Methanomicrobium antiquum]WFN36249.1 hypothetical protein L1994_08850 [Methanomicrobium antiquum]